MCKCADMQMCRLAAFIRTSAYLHILTYLPVNLLLPFFSQYFVSFGKWFGTKKSPISRKWRWMRRFDNKVLGLVDEFGFGLRITSP